jgi:hypothetical protein
LHAIFQIPLQMLQDSCSRLGVICRKISLRVRKVWIQRYTLLTLISKSWVMSGIIPYSIGSLINLRKLDLSNNQLTVDPLLHLTAYKHKSCVTYYNFQHEVRSTYHILMPIHRRPYFSWCACELDSCCTTVSYKDRARITAALPRCFIRL